MLHAEELKKEILSELTDEERGQIDRSLEKLKKWYLENKDLDGIPVDSRHGVRIRNLNAKQRLWLATNGYIVHNYWDSKYGENVITLCLY